MGYMPHGFTRRQQMENELFELTAKLISFKSISPNDGGSMDYIQLYLNELGFSTTRVDRHHTSNLIARFGTTTPIFAYAGHVDVVPPGDINKWSNDPFTMVENNGHLYGRGIADMKGSVACFMLAVKQFLNEYRNSIRGSIMLLITSDEEASGADGTTVIVDYLKQNNLQIDYCLLGEPTSVTRLGDVVKVGRRGSLTGYLEIIGNQGHIAYPNLCKNPIHLFAAALNELITTTWDNGNEYFPPTSLQFANINSGLGVDNVIPGTLLTSFNFRYNNEQTIEQLQKKVIAILEQYGLKYNMKWKVSAKPFYTKPGRLIKAVEQAIKQELTVGTELRTDGGTSDGRFLIDICNELLEFGLSNRYIHQINENIPSTELNLLTKTYKTILNKIFLEVHHNEK